MVCNLEQGAKKIGISRPSFTKKLEDGKILHIQRRFKNDKIKRYIPEIFLDFTHEIGKLKSQNENITFKDAIDIEDLYKSPKNCKVITVNNIKGGVGKTTISVNLAFSLALLRRKVLVIDTDSQANASSYLKAKKTKNNTVTSLIKEYIVERAVSKERIRECIQTTNYENCSIDILPSSILLADAIDSLQGSVDNYHKTYKRIFDCLREDYDYIIIDNPVSTSVPLKLSLFFADEAIYVGEADEDSKEGLEHLIRAVNYMREEFDKEIQLKNLVINKFKAKTTIQKEYKELMSNIASQNGFEDIFVIKDSIKAREARSFQIPLSEYPDELEDSLRASEQILELSCNIIYEDIEKEISRKIKEEN